MENGLPRVVFASADDLEGREIKDGVGVVFRDGGSRSTRPDAVVVVSPSDVLDTWSHYVVERDEIIAAREAVRVAAAAHRAEADRIADNLGGVVMRAPDGVLGVFLPVSAGGAVTRLIARLSASS